MSKRAYYSGIILAALLAACVSKGTVTTKDHHPGYWYTAEQWAGQTCSGSGSSQICTPIYIPVPRYRDEWWTLKIKAGNDASEVDVSQDTYNRAHVGDTYNSDTGELTPQ